jgi:CBS domain-containing protein
VIDADSRLLGVVNIRDLTEYLFPYTAALAQGQGLLAAQPKNLQECTIDEVMQPCEPVHDEQTLDDAARLLMQSCVSEVPVVDGQQRVIGLITLHDVLVACRTALWEG